MTVLVTKCALSAIKHESKDGRITTEQIKQAVFNQLELLSNEKDKLYAEDLKQRARRLKSEWSVNKPLKMKNALLISWQNERKSYKHNWNNAKESAMASGSIWNSSMPSKKELNLKQPQNQ